MKFTCSCKAFEEACCNIVSLDTRKSYVHYRCNAPKSKEIMLSCHKNGISLTWYDLELGIEKAIEANVEEEGNLLLSIPALSPIVKSLKGKERDDITFIANEKYMVDLRVSPSISKFQFFGRPATGYPGIPTYYVNDRFSLSKQLFSRMIGVTNHTFDTSKEASTVTGTLFEQSGHLLNATAVDGCYLISQTESAETDSEFCFALPQKALKALERIFSSEEKAEDVEITVGSEQISLHTNGYSITSQLLKTGDFQKRIAILKGLL